MARFDHTTDNLDNRLSLDEVGQVINDIINNDTDYQREIRKMIFDYEHATDMDEGRICGVCISSLCMVANGNVYPCAGWQNYICGSLKDDTLKNIWDNAPRVQYLRKLRRSDFPKCTGCIDRPFCAMCMVRNANENPAGDPLKINEHFCRVAALNRKIVLDWKAKLA
jgi:radical SAM protein with 4Fe4S-binding SPASM domain